MRFTSWQAGAQRCCAPTQNCRAIDEPMLPPTPVIRITSLEGESSAGAWSELTKFVENGLRMGEGEEDAIVYRDGMCEDCGGGGARDGYARGAAA